MSISLKEKRRIFLNYARLLARQTFMISYKAKNAGEKNLALIVDME